MVQKGRSALSQIKVQWFELLEYLTTWEEASDLRLGSQIVLLGDKQLFKEG